MRHRFVIHSLCCLFIFNVLTLVNAVCVKGQSYTCTVQNQTVNGSVFAFDVYLQNTSSSQTLYLGNCDFSFTFANTNFSGATVDAPVYGTSGSKLETWYSASAQFPSGYPNIIKVSLQPPAFSTQTQFNTRVQDVPVNQSAPGTFIATVTVAGISSPGGSMNLQWRLSSPHTTIVSGFQSSTPWNQNNITPSGIFINPGNSPLPVELLQFTGVRKPDRAELSWKTASELNSLHFIVQRSLAGSAWEDRETIPAGGTCDNLREYSYTDTLENSFARYIPLWYRLKQIDRDGTATETPALLLQAVESHDVSLFPNYPNPARTSTSLSYWLASRRDVEMWIHDRMGRLFQRIQCGVKEPGLHSITIDVHSFPPGTYYYSITAGNMEIHRHMIIAD